MYHEKLEKLFNSLSFWANNHSWSVCLYAWYHSVCLRLGQIPKILHGLGVDVLCKRFPNVLFHWFQHTKKTQTWIWCFCCIARIGGIGKTSTWSTQGSGNIISKHIHGPVIVEWTDKTHECKDHFKYILFSWFCLLVFV